MRHAAVVATGRLDFPDQINDVLASPGPAAGLAGRGRRARGGVAVDLGWSDGRLQQAVLGSDRDARVRVTVPGSSSPVEVALAASDPHPLTSSSA